MEKTKICNEVRCIERKRKDKAKVPTKRDPGPNVWAPRPVKWARDVRPRQNVEVVRGRISNYATCGKRHLGDCCRSMGECLKCESMKRFVTIHSLKIKCKLKGRTESQTRELDSNLVEIRVRTKVVMPTRGNKHQVNVLIKQM